MRRLRWTRTLVPLVIAAAVIPAATRVTPADATHTGSFLQVTPEVTTVDVGTTVTLTAHLFNSLLPLGRQPIGGLVDVDVFFDFIGGPLGSEPNVTCTVPAFASTCTVNVRAQTSGTTEIRSWTEGHDPDSEGRLSNNAAAEDRAADCISPDEGQTDAAVCRSGDNVNDGDVVEPDSTDVVRVTWRDRGLDVAPDNQTRVLGETATLTATAYNQAGSPVAGEAVKWEFFEGSVSFPGKGTTPATPDRTCTTAANGTCSITLTQTANGVDVVCAWTSATPPTVSGKAAGDPAATCNGETLLDLTANDGKPSPADDNQDIARVIWGAGSTPVTTPVNATPVTPPRNGYWLVASDGGIFAFGDAVFRGSTGAIKLNQPMVGIAPTQSRNGYWTVAADGGVFAFGDAVFRGSTGAIKLNQPIVGMAATPTGSGYWLVAKDGGIFAFGGAVFRGSAGGIKLAQPIVGMAPTPGGGGYWLVAADGGVFAFGDAVFRGSTGGIKLAQPIVGIASTPTGLGYWLVAADGGIFAFGDAVFRGSTGGIKLAQPMVGMSRSPSGAGYLTVARDGGIFAFGDAVFRGSTGALRLNQPVVGMTAM